MQYFWASQNKTYRDELAGGYLWAPKSNETGQTPFHWRNVAKVNSGDLIFSYFRQRITAISVARSEAYDAPIPREWEELHDWKKDGWKVDVEYEKVNDPPHLNQFRSEFEQYLPSRSSPLASSGGAQGYLFELPEDAGEFILKMLNWDTFSIADEDNSTATGKNRTTVTITRVGQAKFRNQLKRYWGSQCAVSGSTTVQLLRASHIVSWANSNPEEKVEVYNGLLLSPAYDAAFDAHLISFDDEGRLIHSSQISADELLCLGIDPNAKLRRIERQHRRFLSRHRSNLEIG